MVFIIAYCYSYSVLLLVTVHLLLHPIYKLNFMKGLNVHKVTDFSGIHYKGAGVTVCGDIFPEKIFSLYEHLLSCPYRLYLGVWFFL